MGDIIVTARLRSESLQDVPVAIAALGFAEIGKYNSISIESITRAVPRRIGRTKGGLNSKLHAVCDGQGRPLVMLLSEGQMSDYTPCDIHSAAWLANLASRS